MSARKQPRLDVWLVSRGLAESREKAQALVMAGRVTVDGSPAGKAGDSVPDDAAVEVSPGPSRVSRGALKLEGALNTFQVSPSGRVTIDVGASTGGFTETLLKRGALRVYAVDVGRGQLHERLTKDPRVRVLDRLNARELSPGVIPEPCSLATIDVSFISVLKILPALSSVLLEDADVLVLVKPQFEAGRKAVGKGGIVRDPAHHLSALRSVATGAARDMSYSVKGACASAITGAEGNREFFLHLRNREAPIDEIGLEALIRAAVSE